MYASSEPKHEINFSQYKAYQRYPELQDRYLYNQYFEDDAIIHDQVASALDEAWLAVEADAAYESQSKFSKTMTGLGYGLSEAFATAGAALVDGLVGFVNIGYAAGTSITGETDWNIMADDTWSARKKTTELFDKLGQRKSPTSAMKFAGISEDNKVVYSPRNKTIEYAQQIVDSAAESLVAVVAQPVYMAQLAGSIWQSVVSDEGFNDLSESQQLETLVMNYATEAGTEFIFSGGVAKKGLIDIGKRFGTAATKSIGKYVGSNTAQRIAVSLAHTFGEMFGEGIEEAVSEVLQEGLETVISNGTWTWADPNNVLVAALGGALSSLVMSGGSILVADPVTVDLGVDGKVKLSKFDSWLYSISNEDVSPDEWFNRVSEVERQAALNNMSLKDFKASDKYDAARKIDERYDNQTVGYTLVLEHMLQANNVTDYTSLTKQIQKSYVDRANAIRLYISERLTAEQRDVAQLLFDGTYQNESFSPTENLSAIGISQGVVNNLSTILGAHVTVGKFGAINQPQFNGGVRIVRDLSGDKFAYVDETWLTDKRSSDLLPKIVSQVMLSDTLNTAVQKTRPEDWSNWTKTSSTLANIGISPTQRTGELTDIEVVQGLIYSDVMIRASVRSCHSITKQVTSWLRDKIRAISKINRTVDTKEIKFTPQILQDMYISLQKYNAAMYTVINETYANVSSADFVGKDVLETSELLDIQYATIKYSQSEWRAIDYEVRNFLLSYVPSGTLSVDVFDSKQYEPSFVQSILGDGELSFKQALTNFISDNFCDVTYDVNTMKFVPLPRIGWNNETVIRRKLASPNIVKSGEIHSTFRQTNNDFRNTTLRPDVIINIADHNYCIGNDAISNCQIFTNTDDTLDVNIRSKAITINRPDLYVAAYATKPQEFITGKTVYVGKEPVRCDPTLRSLDALKFADVMANMKLRSLDDTVYRAVVVNAKSTTDISLFINRITHELKHHIQSIYGKDTGTTVDVMLYAVHRLYDDEHIIKLLTNVRDNIDDLYNSGSLYSPDLESVINDGIAGKNADIALARVMYELNFGEIYARTTDTSKIDANMAFWTRRSMYSNGMYISPNATMRALGFEVGAVIDNYEPLISSYSSARTEDVMSKHPALFDEIVRLHSITSTETLYPQDVFNILNNASFAVTLFVTDYMLYADAANAIYEMVGTTPAFYNPEFIATDVAVYGSIPKAQLAKMVNEVRTAMKDKPAYIEDTSRSRAVVREYTPINMSVHSEVNAQELQLRATQAQNDIVSHLRNPGIKTFTITSPTQFTDDFIDDVKAYLSDTNLGSKYFRYTSDSFNLNDWGATVAAYLKKRYEVTFDSVIGFSNAIPTIPTEVFKTIDTNDLFTSEDDVATYTYDQLCDIPIDYPNRTAVLKIFNNIDVVLFNSDRTVVNGKINLKGKNIDVFLSCPAFQYAEGMNVISIPVYNGMSKIDLLGILEHEAIHAVTFDVSTLPYTTNVAYNAIASTYISEAGTDTVEVERRTALLRDLGRDLAPSVDTNIVDVTYIGTLIYLNLYDERIAFGGDYRVVGNTSDEVLSRKKYSEFDKYIRSYASTHIIPNDFGRLATYDSRDLSLTQMSKERSMLDVARQVSDQLGFRTADRNKLLEYGFSEEFADIYATGTMTNADVQSLISTDQLGNIDAWMFIIDVMYPNTTVLEALPGDIKSNLANLPIMLSYLSIIPKKYLPEKITTVNQIFEAYSNAYNDAESGNNYFETSRIRNEYAKATDLAMTYSNGVSGGPVYRWLLEQTDPLLTKSMAEKFMKAVTNGFKEDIKALPAIVKGEDGKDISIIDLNCSLTGRDPETINIERETIRELILKDKTGKVVGTSVSEANWITENREAIEAEEDEPYSAAAFTIDDPVVTGVIQRVFGDVSPEIADRVADTSGAMIGKYLVKDDPKKSIETRMLKTASDQERAYYESLTLGKKYKLLDRWIADTNPEFLALDWVDSSESLSDRYGDDITIENIIYGTDNDNKQNSVPYRAEIMVSRFVTAAKEYTPEQRVRMWDKLNEQTLRRFFNDQYGAYGNKLRIEIQRIIQPSQVTSDVSTVSQHIINRIRSQVDRAKRYGVDTSSLPQIHTDYNLYTDTEKLLDIEKQYKTFVAKEIQHKEVEAVRATMKKTEHAGMSSNMPTTLKGRLKQWLVDSKTFLMGYVDDIEFQMAMFSNDPETMNAYKKKMAPTFKDLGYNPDLAFDILLNEAENVTKIRRPNKKELEALSRGEALDVGALMYTLRDRQTPVLDRINSYNGSNPEVIGSSEVWRQLLTTLYPDSSIHSVEQLKQVRTQIMRMASVDLFDPTEVTIVYDDEDAEDYFTSFGVDSEYTYMAASFEDSDLNAVILNSKELPENIVEARSFVKKRAQFKNDMKLVTLIDILEIKQRAMNENLGDLDVVLGFRSLSSLDVPVSSYQSLGENIFTLYTKYVEAYDKLQADKERTNFIPETESNTEAFIKATNAAKRVDMPATMKSALKRLSSWKPNIRVTTGTYAQFAAMYRDWLSNLSDDNVMSLLQEYADTMGSMPESAYLPMYYTFRIISSSNTNIRPDVRATVEGYTQVLSGVSGINLGSELDVVDAIEDAEQFRLAAVKMNTTANEDLLQQYINACKNKDYTEMLRLQKALLYDVAMKMPHYREMWAERRYGDVLRQVSMKMKAFRFTAVLSKPRTAVQNISSNTILTVINHFTENLAARIAPKIDAKLKVRGEFVLKTKRKSLDKMDVNIRNMLNERIIDNGRLDFLLRGSKYNPITGDIVENLQSQLPFAGPKWYNRFMQKSYDVIMASLRKGDEIFLKRDVIIRMGQYLESAYGTNVADISADEFDTYLRAAIADSMELYLRKPNNLSSWISKVEHTHPWTMLLIDPVLLFPRVTVNITTYLIRHSPLGLINVVRDIASYKYQTQVINDTTIVKETDPLTGKVHDVVKTIPHMRGGDPVRAQNTKDIRWDIVPSYANVLSRDISQASVGTILFSMGLAFGLGGVIDWDEDTYGNLVINFGGTKLTVEMLTPGISALLLGASMTTKTKLDNSRFATIWDVFSQMTVASSFDNMLTYNDSVPDLMNSMWTTYTLQYIPSIFKGIAKVIDPAKKETQGKWYLRMAASVPGVSLVVPDKINPYTGSPLDAGTSYRWFSLLEMFVPTQIVRNNYTIFESEALRVDAPTTGATGKFNINGVEYTYTGKAKTRFQSVRGQYVNALGAELLENDEYIDADDAKRKTMVNSMYYYATLYAKINEWVNYMNGTYTVSDKKEYNTLVAMFGKDKIKYSRSSQKTKFTT